MKKSFSFIGMAMLAIAMLPVFTSCDNGPKDVETTFFKISAEVNGSAVDYTITPTDKNVYYFHGIYKAEDARKWNCDSVLNRVKAEQGFLYSFDFLRMNGYIHQGTRSGKYEGLALDDWAIVVFEVNSDLEPVESTLTVKYLKTGTTEITIKSNTARVKDETASPDLPRIRVEASGSDFIAAITLKTNKTTGKFTEKNLPTLSGEEFQSYIIRDLKRYEIQTLNCEGGYNVDGSVYTLAGEFTVADGAYRYKFSFNAFPEQ